MTAPKPSKALDDPGAFGILTPEQRRTIDGAAYHLLARFAKTKRSSSDWSNSLLLEIHRDLFGDVFPEHAGRLRQKEVTLRAHAVPMPQQIPYRLADMLVNARAIIDDALPLDPTSRITKMMPRIARFHAECVIIQPFIDGNKRWARQVLNAVLTDSGFYPGSEITDEQRTDYLDGIDKAADGHVDQLENIIYKGWLILNKRLRAGKY